MPFPYTFPFAFDEEPMGTFAASQATPTQSSDGKTVSLQDTSNYGSNTEGYTINDFTTREWRIYNASETLIDTISLGLNLTVTYEIDADQWLKFRLFLDGASVPVYSDDKNVLLARNTDNALDTVLQFGCCTLGKQTFENIKKVDIYERRAEKATIYGKPTAADNYIKAANAYLP